MNAVAYGVCRLSVVPVRAEAAHRSEQVTQLLFGEHYEVIDTANKNWVRIRINADQYEGWIDLNQHHEISFEYFEYLNRAELKITTDLTSSLLYNKNPVVILMGSIIPISSTELFRMEDQFAFNGESKNTGQKREFDYLRTIATRYLNAPYLWGGRTPFGIDCSGLTQVIFRICGYHLQRDAWQQANQGRPVPGLNEYLPGDLAFFSNGEGKITHVGILLPDRKIIHASGRVRMDLLTGDGILQAETKTVTHSLHHIRRILPDVQSPG